MHDISTLKSNAHGAIVGYPSTLIGSWQTYPLNEEPEWWYQGNLKGNLLWRLSCRHVWRWVIVPPFFFSLLSLPSKCELPFPRGLKSCTHNGYRVVNHAVTIMCADRAKCSRQIRRYNNSHPYVTGQYGHRPIALTQGSKRDPIPLAFPWMRQNLWDEV